MTKEKFIKNYSEACDFLGLKPKPSSDVAVAMALNCEPESEIEFKYGEEYTPILEYCSEARREIDVVNHFIDRDPRRVRYLLLRLWRGGKLKKLARGTYIKEKF